MVDSPIRVQKLNQRKDFFAAQLQEERVRRYKLASSSPSYEIPQLASGETSLRISETVVSDIFQSVEADSSDSSISCNGSHLQDDLKLFDLPVKSNLIPVDVSVSSAHAFIMDTVADSNSHINLSLDRDNDFSVPLLVDGADATDASLSTILFEGSFCRSLLQPLLPAPDYILISDGAASVFNILLPEIDDFSHLGFLCKLFPFDRGRRMICLGTSMLFSFLL